MPTLLTTTGNEQGSSTVLQEIEALCIMHERITQSSECRDFNRCVALLLQKLEDEGYTRLADRTMDLLSSCNPKDLSQCDSIQRARGTLERLRDLARRELGGGTD